MKAVAQQARKLVPFCVAGWLILGLTPALAGAQDAASTVSSAAPGTDAPVPYTLQVGDVLMISVWKNAELGATVPIRPDGHITLPLVGEIAVLGKTPEETRVLLTESFKDYVAAPAVSVVVSQINSWKVFMLGEVRAPGVYDVLRPTTLLQALAMAGGLTEFAKKDEVVLLRSEGGIERRRVLSVKDITTGRQLSDNVLLKPGDTIVVP